MANLANGTTLTNGKYNSRAVAAFHLETAKRCREHCLGALAGVIYQPAHEKMVAREAIARARSARLNNMLYEGHDFHVAHLPG